jgi:cell division transport system permease protein
MANRVMTGLAVATTAVAFFITGLLLLFNQTAAEGLRIWAQRAQVNFFLDDALTPSETAALVETLSERPDVETVRAIGKNDAVLQLETLFPGLRESLSLLEANPLPASLEVTLRPEYGTPESVRRFVEEGRALPGVTDLQYDLPWMERVERALWWARYLGYALASVFLISTAFTLSNVVRITVYARRDEIAIMRVVGATNSFIKGPFLLEAAAEGAAGAVLGLAALYGVHQVASLGLSRLPWAGAVAHDFLSAGSVAALAAAAAAMGMVGSFLALRRLPAV